MALLSVLCSSLLWSARANVDDQPVSFVTIGDWGGMTLGSYHTKEIVEVSKQMSETMEELNAQFVVNVGDSFYYYGVKSVTDSQWDSDFENVFTAESTMVPWYSILGNHDYAWNPEAQVEYKSSNNNRWIMDARYYTKRVEIGSSGNYISFVFLDASPCQAVYRSDNASGWDPCGTSYPHPAYCPFHANVIAQSCEEQYNWLQGVVQSIPSDDWKIAVNHAPADEIDVNDIIGVLQDANFDLYLNGHVHDLALYKIDGKGTYVESGAGSMVYLWGDDDKPKKRVKRSSSQHEYNPIWSKRVAGFTTHTFSKDFSSLATNFLDSNGKIIQSTVTHKGESNQFVPPPAPERD